MVSCEYKWIIINSVHFNEFDLIQANSNGYMSILMDRVDWSDMQ